MRENVCTINLLPETMREQPLSCKLNTGGDMWMFSTLQIFHRRQCLKPHVSNFTEVGNSNFAKFAETTRLLV